MHRTALIASILASLVLAAFARDFAMPPLVPVGTLAFHDAHPDEKATLAADPYDTPQKAALFHSDMLGHAILPVLVVFTNDGDAPILLDNARFQLLTRDRAKAEPFTLDDLRRALTSIQAPRSRSRDQIPIPLPGKNAPHGGVSPKDVDQLQHVLFAARAIAPHSTQQGFLFFDTTGLDHPADGARLFLTGVSVKEASGAHGHELMYFEVPLSQP
jgi:hypothetical protein